MASRSALGTSPLPQIRSNTGLRGIAALLVVAYHLQFAGYVFPIGSAAGLINRSYLMVDLFFILSGFILTYVNKSEALITSEKYTTFLIGRLIRIYPLHIFCMAYLIIFAGAADLIIIHYYGHRSIFGDWSTDGVILMLSQLILINGWFFTYSGWNTPTWSVSVEIIAYAIFPLLSLLLLKFRFSYLSFLLFSILFYLIVAITLNSVDIIGRIAVFRCLAGFMVGMVICHHRERIFEIPTVILSIAQIFILFGIAMVLLSSVNDCLVIPLFSGLVTATSDDRGIFSRILGWNIINFLGKISYSVYLNHVCLLIIILPIFRRFTDLVNQTMNFDGRWLLPIFFILVIFISTLTYRYIELPIGRFLTRRLHAESHRFSSTMPSVT